jgi:ABC-type phosphate/phosphonate transport system substrate-binding protein
MLSRSSSRLFALAVALALPCAAARGQQARLDVLHIGATGTLTGDADSQKEKGAVQTLRRFIKDETGFTNDIVRQGDWQQLADKMKRGDLHVGVFQGYEFAWAQEKHPDLKPLAIAVNGQRYPAAYVLAQRDNAAKDFAGLKGQSLYLPVTNQEFLRLFVDRQSEANGKKADEFFGKITTPDNVEDALDDVVDGKVRAVVVDGAALEAYRRRKPGRARQLKEVARSEPFPPVVVAYYGSTPDEATRRLFKERLLGAAKKEKGEMLLTLSRLTGFEDVPEDFAKVLGETRKAYPPPGAKSK